MKKLIALLLSLSGIYNLCAQDTITKRDGSEISAKVIEVEIDKIRFRKHENLNGPIYSLSKREVFLIEYENGSKDVFEANDQLLDKVDSKTSRKGAYLGFHITPGAGSILTDNYEFDFGLNAGIDLSIYFSDLVGIKTGISYLSLPIKARSYNIDYQVSFSSLAYEARGNISSLGVPLKFLLTTGGDLGFYLESGFNLYVPVSSYLEDQGYRGGDINKGHFLATESVVGFNIKTSETMSLNIGTSFHYSLTNNFMEEKANGILVGLHAGVLFNLKK